GEQELHDLRVVQQLIYAHPFVGQDHPQGTAVQHGLPHGGELIPPAVGAGGGAVHEVALYVPVGGAERLGGGVVRVELLGPRGVVVAGGGQGQRGLRVHAHLACRVLQQPAGLVVEPRFQGMVQLGGAHLPLVGGGVVGVGKSVQGGLVE